MCEFEVYDGFPFVWRLVKAVFEHGGDTGPAVVA